MGSGFGATGAGIPPAGSREALPGGCADGIARVGATGRRIAWHRRQPRAGPGRTGAVGAGIRCRCPRTEEGTRAFGSTAGHCLMLHRKKRAFATVPPRPAPRPGRPARIAILRDWPALAALRGDADDSPRTAPLHRDLEPEV